MGNWAGERTGIADILSTEVVEGEVRAQLGYYAGPGQESPGIAASAPVWGQFGFVSRPAEPDGDGAAMAVFEVDGDQKTVTSTRDLRMAAKLPDLKPGESMCCGFAGQFIRFHQNGGLTLFTTTDGTPDGDAIYLKLVPDDGVEPSPGLVFESPWVRVMCGKLGFRVLHSSGAELELGALGGLPAPLDALGSMAKLKAGIVSIQGGAVSIGNPATPGLANEVSVIALQTYMAAVATYLTATNVLLTSLLPISGVTAAQLTTFATATTAFNAATVAASTAVANLGKPI